jgi:hypothetical protein
MIDISDRSWDPPFHLLQAISGLRMDIRRVEKDLKMLETENAGRDFKSQSP